ncbi:dihydrodipicolinate synthase [Legionella beliardensis]|uniref:4-hydroxy-tetrahydrodipicolinate synthase n=1 Tax=Legionella beliardensis TaxID=91822 RepID=A0A378I2M9_9GAMM|nr:4-hydroxy-tetrahydrodipicolinate synthase [Legionella beliardensis]STX29418.1 dihydrodipicolinate synthase [Legionella beliardensis]
MFRGSMVALVTPMQDDAVDVGRLRELVEFHIAAGTHAIVAAGTTGEAGTLSCDEKFLVIKTVLEQARERVPVIAGTAANATRDCIELTRMAMDCGAHAALIMTPACIRPTQEGLYQHYSQIAASVAIPLILYNVPSRTACDLLPQTVARLAQISNIVGIKEASGKLERLKEIWQLCDCSLDIYSGDDDTAAQWLLAGAKGVISVTANVAPKQMAKLCDMALDGNSEEAIAINEQLQALHRLLFIESNPIPVKWALSRMGLIANELRLPLTPLSSEHHATLEQALSRLQLI